MSTARQKFSYIDRQPGAKTVQDIANSKVTLVNSLFLHFLPKSMAQKESFINLLNVLISHLLNLQLPPKFVVTSLISQVQ